MSFSNFSSKYGNLMHTITLALYFIFRVFVKFYYFYFPSLPVQSIRSEFLGGESRGGGGVEPMVNIGSNGLKRVLILL